jgi:hypothetical protein
MNRAIRVGPPVATHGFVIAGTSNRPEKALDQTAFLANPALLSACRGLSIRIIYLR